MKEGCLEILGFEEEEIAFNDIPVGQLLYQRITTGDVEPNDTQHVEIHRRCALSRQSKTIYILTPLHSEIFDQNKWLPPHSKLFISMEQTSPSFALLNKTDGMGDNPLKIEIEKCEPLVRMIEVDSTVSREIESVSYGGSSMLFPLRCMKMEQHRIPANLRDISVTNILVGENELPCRIFLVFVRHDAVSGDLKLDPFNYQDFSMNRIGLRVGGWKDRSPSWTSTLTREKQ